MYKVGDKVLVDPNLKVTTKGIGVNSEMVKLAGKLVTIREIDEKKYDDDSTMTYYLIKENPRWWWVDSFFIEEEVGNKIKESYDKLFERSDANV